MRRFSSRIWRAAASAALAAVLLIAGGLALWGSAYVHNTVQGQLASQKIYFPPASAFAHPKVGTEITPSMIPSVSQYAGQQMLTGQQAEVWANDFIAVHLVEIGGGKTYAQLSTEAIAQPANLKLAAQVATVFKGETLRGLLLNAYAFGTMGTIAGLAAIAAFIAAAAMLILGGLGLAHARRVSTATEILSGHRAPAPDQAAPALQANGSSTPQPSGDTLVTAAPASSD